ncbi:glycosyltransferase family 32 protein [Acinetobacter schindleri]|uniref:glycosyltransferase family 32 protein n=1 Tax=Acinetobacter schindleri TaxID=108981 RepID=UPI003F56E7A0
MSIPKIIHQTYSSKDLPDEIQKIVNELKSKNPEWEYRFYDDNDIVNYIETHFEKKYLHAYMKINKKYGAAKADFFRYLVVYKEGGVYLDIKSTCINELDNIISKNDDFILCHWQNEVGMKNESAGIHKELKGCEYGEFQQWHIIAKPESIYLKKVIELVVNNINNYNPWIHGIGQKAVLRITGPIAYTKAILPLLNQYKCKIYRYDKDVGLIYSGLDYDSKHGEIIKNHYSLCDDTLIECISTYEKIRFLTFKFFRKFKRLIF